MSGCEKMTRICASVSAWPRGLISCIQFSGFGAGSGETAGSACGGPALVPEVQAVSSESNDKNKNAGAPTKRHTRCMTCLLHCEFREQRLPPVAAQNFAGGAICGRRSY